MTNTDKVYAENLDSIEDFSFDSNVADVFPDMLQRSIPGYDHLLQMLGSLTSRFEQADANYYDLGCSLGAATLAMRRNITLGGGLIHAIDNSKAMLDRCQRHVEAFNSPTQVNYILRDINDVHIENAAIVVLNFTLQFIAPDKRQALLDKIYQGLRPGGLLFLSEKITFNDPLMNQLLTDCYYDFKRSNHYSELEISQKRSALENVMFPEPYETHSQRFKNAGFIHYGLWYQQMNFASMLAIKEEAHAR